MTYQTLDNLSRDEWLEVRGRGIGSSEIASVLGLGFETPQELYARKIAPPSSAARASSERMELGSVLEPYIAQRYARETGFALNKGPQIAWPADRPWQLVSGEYEALDRLVECKTVFAYPAWPWGEPETDQIPDNYLLQVTQQAGVLEADRIDVAALFVGHEFRRYCVTFDGTLFEILTEAAAEFWERVIHGPAVGADWKSKCADEVETALRTVRADLEVSLGAEAEDLAKQYKQFAELKAEAEREQKRVKETLLSQMGEAAYARLPGGGLLTQKLVKRGAYSVDASEYILFSVKQAKSKLEAA